VFWIAAFVQSQRIHIKAEGNRRALATIQGADDSGETPAQNLQEGWIAALFYGAAPVLIEQRRLGYSHTVSLRDHCATSLNLIAEVGELAGDP
jgi:hypothetical protein